MDHMGDAGPATAMFTAQTAIVRRVAFGRFDDWTDGLRQCLDARFAPSFVDLEKVHPDDFDALVPLQIDHYGPLGRWPALRGRKFFHPSPEVVSLCDDKLRFARFLIAEGFADCVPALRRPGAPYPYVWKRRSGYWGLHCRIVTGPADERDLDLDDEAWFAQALAPGNVEFATHVLRTEGRVRYASTFGYEMARPGLVKGALQAPRMTGFSRGCPHLGLFSEILSRLGYEGVACFDYRVVDGRPLLFEINPRFGASLCWDVNAYLDAYLDALAR